MTRKLSPLRVMVLRAASRAEPVGSLDMLADTPASFRAPENREIRVAARVSKAALLALAEKWPLAIAFDELLSAARDRLEAPAHETEDDRRQLASDLLQSYAAGVIELHHAPSPFVIEAGERPLASAVARLHASRGTRVTSLRHEPGTMVESTRAMFMLLDGRRTRSEIASLCFPGRDAAESRRDIDTALERLGRLALLVR